MMRRAVIFLFCLAGFALAQPTIPNELWGTIFFTVAPTASDRQTVIWRSDGAGRMVTDISTGTSNDLLMVDGASYVLQTDAASKICLAAGC